MNYANLNTPQFNPHSAQKYRMYELNLLQVGAKLIQ
jgi:hypothetical protein